MFFTGITSTWCLILEVRLLAPYFFMNAIPGIHPSGHAEHVQKRSPRF